MTFDKQSVHWITWPPEYRRTTTWECQFWGLLRTPATADLPRLTSFPKFASTPWYLFSLSKLPNFYRSSR